MRHSFLPCVLAFAACALIASTRARAQLTTQGTFTTGLAGVSLGVDHTTGEVWAYASFGAQIFRYSPTGAPLGSVPRPGESANDVDIEVTSSALTLGSTPLPEGTLLFINGESGTVDIYAINKNTGAVLATLVTQFGVSHVVGGAHHAGRGTIFLVQDRVPGSPNANVVAEINPQTGAVLGSFRITDVRPLFTVNFGDLEVGGNGNLFIASSDEVTIAEFTPAGVFVAEHALPTGVDNLSGIGIDRSRCELWGMETGGIVWRLGASPSTHPICDPPGCVADMDDGTGTGTRDGGVGIEDLLYYLGQYDAGNARADVDDGTGTGTRDGGVGIEDLLYYLARYDAGC